MFRRLIRRVDSSLRIKTALEMGLAVAIAVGVGGAYIVKVQRDAQYGAINQKAQILATSGAQTAASVFEAAVKDGELTRDQLFDANYQKIDGSNPQRYHSQFDTFTDQVFQKIEDGYLADTDVVFAAVVDRNGYLPTHNTKFAAAPMNNAANRTKRIFNDPVGLAAARNVTPLLKQVYKRDTGETMWDVSAPIVVNGEHWGAFRVGFSIQGVNATVAATTQKIVIVLVSVIVLVCVLSILIATHIARSTSRVVKHLSDLEENCLTDLETGMGALADGNLTVGIAPRTAKIDHCSADEVGRAAASVNKIIDKAASTIGSYNRARLSLASLIAAVKKDADAVLDSAQQLGETSRQMALASDQIASAMSEVSGSSVTLAGVAQSSAREVEDLATGADRLAGDARANARSASDSRANAAEIGDRITAVAGKSQDVSSSADVSRAAAVQGAAALRQAIESMQSIAGAVQQTSATVDQLGEYGQQIGDIVKVIDEIAGQTNLLALNAAIEAARAGEQGRGFAVVADNVRTLAERSSQSTKEIAQLVARVRQGTEEAVEAMASSVENVEAGRAITAQAGQALDSIITSVEQSARAMEQIAADVNDLSGGAGRIVASADAIAGLAESSAVSAEGMATGTGRVTAAILQVSAMSEETSAAAEQVSASTEELTAQTQELANTAAHMTRLAVSLDQAARRFRWDVSEQANTPGA